MKLHTFDVMNTQGERVGSVTVWCQEEELPETLAARYPKLKLVALSGCCHWMLRSRSGAYLGQLRRVREQE